MDNLQHLPAVNIIEVSYHGPTNTRGSRVKMKSLRFGDSVTIPYNYEFNNARDMAHQWLQQHGADVTAQGWDDNSGKYYLIVKPTDNQFQSMKDIELEPEL